MDYTERDVYGICRPRGKSGAVTAPELVGADALIGSDIYSQQNELVGVIKEIMLDRQSGRVAHAVLSIGNPDIGETLFNAPWRAFMFDAARKRWVLNVEQMGLESKQKPSPGASQAIDGDSGGGYD
ncbi:PRC-barrel domain-containing protein [Chromobacterium sphagni]|uniref:PRC-barrel domain-containing protein n=1 Tax=Chromobacterium sphagni TaxID=1903179 RepID=A0A1S1X4H6_9NEIS|nr:PRC-barrel domain-containing protein [Chromobacterium sphagni]OHX14389.1 hypothetical protein BI347_13415 [Chromobacterium sphagni]OHX20778.1 hypothetical protein BI344_14145 [Chromobacterium sphagni]